MTMALPKNMNTYAQKISSIATSLPWIMFRKDWDIQILPILAKDQKNYGVIFHFLIKSVCSSYTLKVTFKFKKGASHIPYFTIFNTSTGEKVGDNIDANDTGNLFSTISKAFGENSLATIGIGQNGHNLHKRVN